VDEAIPETPEATTERRPSLVESWQAALATLPSDWSDAVVELDLDAEDTLDHAALHLAPLNPRRDAHRLCLRFRAARTAGYGASAGMVERCMERCDGEGILGSVTIERALSGSRPVGTQGPVWLLDGRTV
jgi:hypothetical protein